jgi:hypothetical protein
MRNAALKRLLGMCLYVLASAGGSWLAHYHVPFVERAPEAASSLVPVEVKQVSHAPEASSGSVNAIGQWGPWLIALSIRVALGMRGRRPRN